MKIKELLLRQKNNRNVAIKCSDRTLTYEQWCYCSVILGDKIIDMVEKNSKCIAIFLPNSIEYAISYFGILFSNKVVIPINPQARGVDICSTLEYCEVDLIITKSIYKSFLQDELYLYTNKVAVYYIDTQEEKLYGKGNWINKSDELTFAGTSEDVAIMLHTSGTTSDPKRVMLTSKNLLCNVESNIESLRLSRQDKVLIALPMFFGYCNTAQFLTHIYLGSSMVIMDTIFLPKLFFEIVQEEKITNFTGVPTMLLMILNYRYADQYDYSTLRYICFGGGVMPVEKLKQLIVKFPNIGFVHTYGQTECSPRVTALLAENSILKIGSVGKSIPGVEVRIVDLQDNPVKATEVGEITVRGNNVMKGYYKQLEKTKNIMRNGWLHTGDIGYLDKEGYLYLTGRIKNIIISGGINIYPEEIEQLLLQHECVEEVLVIGKPHDLLGEVPIAQIVLKSKIKPKELRQYCKKNMADYKIPTEFEFVSSLEKTYNGKIKRC